MTTATRLSDAAVRLAATYGINVTIVRDTGAYVPATGAVGAGTQTQTVRATDLIAYHQRLIDGDMVRAGDTQVVVPAANAAWAPRQGDRVTAAGIAWTVVQVQASRVQGQGIAYTLQLRQGGA
jgi:hypothetical protein